MSKRKTSISELSGNEMKYSSRPTESSDIFCQLCGGQETGEPDCDECGGRGANIYERYRRMKKEERISEMFDNQYEND